MKQIALAILVCCTVSSCRKLNDLTQAPELAPLEQGFKTSATIGYCASLAFSAFTGESLPPNVSFSPGTSEGYTSSGIIHISITEQNPLPFNHSVGDMYIAGLWDGDNGGVISILFGDFDIITSQIKVYGIYAVPVSKNVNTGMINTAFAQEDIIIGQGSDTLLDLSLSKPKFDATLAKLNNNSSTDIFTVVKQNFWVVSIDANNTSSNLYDDILTLNGGGQIVESTSNSGGVLYHAMIQTQFSFGTCTLNPISGTAFVQNIKATGSSVDLGNITVNFHNTCDGKATIILATGKYLASTGSTVILNWN